MINEKFQCNIVTICQWADDFAVLSEVEKDTEIVAKKGWDNELRRFIKAIFYYRDEGNLKRLTLRDIKNAAFERIGIKPREFASIKKEYKKEGYAEVGKKSPGLEEVFDFLEKVLGIKMEWID